MFWRQPTLRSIQTLQILKCQKSWERREQGSCWTSWPILIHTESLVNHNQLKVFRMVRARKASILNPIQNILDISAPMMKKKHRQIQWTENTAYEVYNQYRALSDLSKLFSFWEETGVKVRFQDIVHPEVINSVNLGQRAPNAKPGQVFSIKQKGQERLLCVKCKEGWVAFRSFYYGPKKVMKASDFYAGYVSKHKDRDLFFVTKENPWFDSTNR